MRYLLVSSTIVQWIGLCLIPGLACGILYPAMSVAVQAPAKVEDIPSAAAMSSFFRSLGQTLGIALGGLIFQNTFKLKLEQSGNENLKLYAGELAQDAGSLAEVMRLIMEQGQVLLATDLATVYVESLKMVWTCMSGVALIALILSVGFIKKYSLTMKTRE